MRTLETDVAVIGAGTAGLGARREAELQGARTLLVEAGPYGTTCARVGCMPSKLLVAAAQSAHDVARAGLFGVRVEGRVRVDGPAVLGRVRRERDRFVGFVTEYVDSLPEGVRLSGRARFVAPTTLEVDGSLRVQARAVVVATGSAPVVPRALAGLGEALLTTDSLFELPDLPGSLAVIGAGPVGLELGQALRRLGVRTRLFARDARLGPLSDPEVGAAAREILGAEIDLELPVEVSALPGRGGRVQLGWRPVEANARAAPAKSEGFDALLAAAGRRPQLRELGLEHTGLELDEAGVPRFDPATLQCGDAPIFLAGDVTGSRAVLHEAADEGRIAGFNAAHHPEVRAHRRRARLEIVFTEPQMAVVGAPYAEIDPEETAIGAVDYGDQGRARVIGRNAGRVRVYARRGDGRLLGAEMLGPDVEHTAHLLAWAVQRELSVPEALALPFYHPVVEEGIRAALREAGHGAGIVRERCARDLDCGPGA